MSGDAVDKPLLEQFLAEQDVSCPCCKYNLRNLTGKRCPECGQELKLSVGVVQPRMAAQITGLVALASGAGFNGLLVIYFVVISCIESNGPSKKELITFLIVCGGGFLYFAWMMAIWLRSWRRLQAASPWRQWGTAIGLWVLPLIDVVIIAIKS